ncbi:plasmid replication initiator TrfA [Burkholderia cepacia]|uniref:plasmid replication initiator TrfA n=1 Tax=Burkholderia cepacia TaxID=292 RepID=UPI00158A5D49|nr:plasmid replication initiator TrfA [Burkholderia cepacia]
MDASESAALGPLQAFAPIEVIASIRERNIERALVDAQLPLWPELVRGVPNGVLRSALFGAIKRGKRKYMEREAIACVKGVSIVYTGPRLDQSDLDVWEGALHLARLVKLGNRIEFTEKAFLRLIGRGGPSGGNIGKSDREWLRKVLARLKATAVEVTQGPYTYIGSLIDDCFRDSTNGRSVVILNPRMRVIFNHDSWTQIDWSIRHALIGHPLAQWLHGFYSTHAAPMPYKVETLHLLCGSEAGENATTDAERNKALLGWVSDSLDPGFKALKHVSDRAGQLFSWEIGKDGLVRVTRAPSASQQRHLRGRARGRASEKREGDRIRT